MDVTGPVVVEIDELDLGAVPPARRFAVAAALEHELTRLVATGGLPAGADGVDAAVRTGPALPLPLDANPVLVGQALARSVYEGLTDMGGRP
jgi:hypothetical protein